MFQRLAGEGAQGSCSIQAVPVLQACFNEGTRPASLKGNSEGIILLNYCCSSVLFISPALKKGWEHELLSSNPVLYVVTEADLASPFHFPFTQTPK